MKGIILAGGAGTRLFPLTLVTSKQLLPVYDKPMIYYPLSTLMRSGIRDILLISTPEDTPRFEALLGNGEQFGLHLSYKVQPAPDGLAQSFLLGEEFLAGEGGAMILGDNLFYGNGLGTMLRTAVRRAEEQGRATIFGCYVKDPERFGVVGFDEEGHVTSIVEKPAEPQSNYAVTGIYFYPAGVSAKAATLRPSARGELEITDLNRQYLEEGRLTVELMSRGFTWLDTGTHQSLADATNFVRAIIERQGLQIACIEEIAWSKGWIDDGQLRKLAGEYGKSTYGSYLKGLV